MGFVWIWVVVVCGVDYRNAYLGFVEFCLGVGYGFNVDEYGMGFVLNDESSITLCQRVRLQRGFRPRPE